MSSYFVSCAKYLEGLLREELLALNIQQVKETVGGVYFEGELIDAYRVCLWSRVANHVFFTLKEFEASNGDELYEAVSMIDWSLHFNAEESFRVDVTGEHAEIRHPHFIAQRVKDAIVDQYRDKVGERPSIDREYPDVCLHLHVHHTDCVLSVNLSGESLHKRGYRLEGGVAPLKETLAAALLYRAKWPERVKASNAILFDPFCGTGTLLIEAALMAYDIAPQISRDYFGFLGWKLHQPLVWQALKEDALQRKTAGLLRSGITIIGSDIHHLAVIKSRENAKRAGIESLLEIELADATVSSTPEFLVNKTGLIICNPPYGERLQTEEIEELEALFFDFGKRLQQDFMGWQLSVFSGAPVSCLKRIGFRLKKEYALMNGAIPCRLYQFDLQADSVMRYESAEEKEARLVTQLLAQGLSSAAQMLANRVKKNLDKWQRFAKQEKVSSYRLYDVDLPEYAVAVDYYEGGWLHIQEYAAPKEIDPEKTKKHLLEILAVFHQVCAIPLDHIILKVRERQKGSAQYEKLDEKNQYEIIREGAAEFWVNFRDYLDTGIFLDHRLVRKLFAESSRGKYCLNLFAYTCSASVHALLAGAKRVTNVDLSKTYLEWGKENYKLNQLRYHENDFIHADCLQWLKQERASYDLIFLNPPTFSNSKRMTEVLGIQRDHVELLTLTLARLTPSGVLFFATNAKNFKLDHAAFSEYEIKDISAVTLCKDFARQANRHHVWVFNRHK